jgi:hypothetical protein
MNDYQPALEIHVEDPDEHILRFGFDPKEGQPFSKWVAWYLEGSQSISTDQQRTPPR